MGVTLISSQTASGNPSTITFSSIPQTYDHLLLLVSASDTVTSQLDAMFIRVGQNNDTYNFATNILMNGSTTVVGNTSSTIRVWNNGSQNAYYSSGYRPTSEWFIPNYTTTSRGKAIFFRGGTQTNLIGNSISIYGAGFYNNTPAVSSIWMRSDQAGFHASSIFTLYGIK